MMSGCSWIEELAFVTETRIFVSLSSAISEKKWYHVCYGGVITLTKIFSTTLLPKSEVTIEYKKTGLSSGNVSKWHVCKTTDKYTSSLILHFLIVLLLMLSIMHCLGLWYGQQCEIHIRRINFSTLPIHGSLIILYIIRMSDNHKRKGEMHSYIMTST